MVKSGPAPYDRGMDEITAFISYSHDSDEHREQVLALSERLRADGIKTFLDQYVNGSPQQGWPRWMLDQLDAADFVLVVCTKTYYRRFRGHEEPGKGKDVDWEGALITQGIYDSRSRTLKFVPVFLSGAVEDWIPEPLRAVSHYALTSEGAYQRLYDFLLEQGRRARASGQNEKKSSPTSRSAQVWKQSGVRAQIPAGCSPYTVDASAIHPQPAYPQGVDCFGQSERSQFSRCGSRNSRNQAGRQSRAFS